MMRLATYLPLVAAAFMAAAAAAQQPFELDESFRTQIVEQNVNDLLIRDDGKVIISGRIRFPGDMFERGGALLDQSGNKDDAFPDAVSMGGRLIRRQDLVYSRNGPGVRRSHMDGTLDQSFILMTSDPLFGTVQGGDFHVFPDGRVLMSGVHILSDTIRGFTGIHNLIWFSNTGYLDTTRIHRKASGAIERFRELPDGKFICRGTGSLYEGQPVDRFFRIHANGDLDTTFHTGAYWGAAYEFTPLPDGRIYAGGIFKLTATGNDTLRLVRFMPDGSLDPTFTPPQISIGAQSAPFSGSVSVILPWANGTLLVAGQFQTVNGQTRNSICMLDSTGQLLPAFSGAGVGPYVGMTGFTYRAIAAGRIDSTNNHLYLCGAYNGYNDGTTNDPLQRFVTRLHIGDPLSVGVSQPAPAEQAHLHLFPNPASSHVAMDYTLPPGVKQGQLLVRDAQGRTLARFVVGTEQGQQLWDTRRVPAGLYTVELHGEGRTLRSEKLVVQP